MVTVLLVAFVFVKTVHANSLDKAHQAIVASQQEASEIKTQLEDELSEKQKLAKEVKLKDEKIQQLKKENTQLKE